MRWSEQRRNGGTKADLVTYMLDRLSWIYSACEAVWGGYGGEIPHGDDATNMEAEEQIWMTESVSLLHRLKTEQGLIDRHANPWMAAAVLREYTHLTDNLAREFKKPQTANHFKGSKKQRKNSRIKSTRARNSPRTHTQAHAHKHHTHTQLHANTHTHTHSEIRKLCGVVQDYTHFTGGVWSA